jgi:FixJ family two-component response regulator
VVLASLYPGIIAHTLAQRYPRGMVVQMETKLVAVVDDDELMRNALQGLLKAAGYSSRVFASAEEFLGSGLQRTTACLIADVRMPGMSGLELFAKLNDDRCGIPTIFITAHGGTKMRMEALRAGAAEFLTKPFDNTVLLQHVRAALES